jgi:DNA polymerase (family 10)
MKTKASQRPNKFAVATALQEIGVLLRLKTKDQYRSRAYAKAAQAIAELDTDLGKLVQEKRLTDLKGVGESLARVIEELYNTGRSSMLEELRADLPPGVIALSQVPGLTLNKIQALNKALGITSVADLNAAIEAHKLREVPGFSAETEDALRQQISRHEDRNDRMLLIHALRIAQKVIEHLKTFDELVRADVAGSARRWKETVSSIRVTACVSGRLSAAFEHFLLFPSITEVENRSRTSLTASLIDGISVTVSVANTQGYSNLLHQQTGSKAHRERLEAIAKTKGIRLAAEKMAFISGCKKLAIESEADIYRHLDMQYVPPELREDDGEIEDAFTHKIPDDLITIQDIKGMIHCHTTYSDGSNTVEEMARAAESMGMKYMTITDHSPTAHYAGGLKIDRLKKQWDEINRVQERVAIKLLRGTESDILRDGSLDYPDEVLEKFDVIIASIHNRYKLDEEQMTTRVITAMKNPLFKIWGHPLGRLVLRRPPIDCRVEEILDVIARSGAAVEISGDPHRLDLEPRWIKEARKRRIKFVISTDAHSISDLNNLKFGIGIARRGGVRRDEVLNALNAKAFQHSVKPSV